MRRVFVDTSAFVALRNRAEGEHEAARAALRELLSAGAFLFTSNYVFAETYTALLVRVGRDEAVRWGRAFREGTAIEIVRSDLEVDDAAWGILESHEDKSWSYVDANSFALMEKEDVQEAFALDANFRQRGLQVVP